MELPCFPPTRPGTTHPALHLFTGLGTSRGLQIEGLGLVQRSQGPSHPRHSKAAEEAMGCGCRLPRDPDLSLLSDGARHGQAGLRRVRVMRQSRQRSWKSCGRPGWLCHPTTVWELCRPAGQSMGSKGQPAARPGLQLVELGQGPLFSVPQRPCLQYGQSNIPLLACGQDSVIISVLFLEASQLVFLASVFTFSHCDLTSLQCCLTWRSGGLSPKTCTGRLLLMKV